MVNYMSLRRCSRCGFYYPQDQFGTVMINGELYPDMYDKGCRKYVELNNIEKIVIMGDKK